jgi:class 3 adenylate cyclase
VDVPPVRFAKLGRDRIAYQVVGDGPIDLLWVPQIGDALDARWEYHPFVRFLRRLASFTRLILFDRRGIGASDPVSLEALPRWEEWTDDALAVMDAVGSERAAVLGCNESGQTALLFAATRPERAHSLVLFTSYARVLVDSDLHFGMTPDEADRIMSLIEETWGLDADAALGMALGMPDRADDPAYIRWNAKNQRMSCSPREAGVWLRQGIYTDVRDVLPSVHVPTLVLHRQQSPIVPLDHGRYLAEHIPRARLVIVPGADATIYTQPNAQILDHIEQFLTGTPPDAGADRVLASILYTDIVASTEQAARLGDRRWRSLLDSHDVIAKTVTDQHGGRLVKLTGDGILATFDGPGRAIRCAAAMREALAPLGIKIRAGLHTGEIERRGDDIGGIGVHVAARVLGYAAAGETLVSAAVPLLVAGSGLEFEDRGEHELKGVPGSWRLFAVEG